MSGAIVDLTSATGLGSIGPRVVGSILGVPYQHFRPQSTGPALASGNLIGSLLAWITVDQAGMGNQPPNKPLPFWFGAFDPAQTQAGDYLVGPLGTFFIANQDLPAPISLVYCNETFTVSKVALSAPGPSFRGGASLTDTVIAASYPGWLALSTRRNSPETHLPGQIGMQNITAVLPPSLPAPIGAGDTMQTADTPPVRYTVQGASLTPSGWSIAAVQATA